MKKEDCYILGYVSRTVGVDGRIEIFLDTDQPEAYEKLPHILLDFGTQILPFFITEFKRKGNKAVLRLEDTSTPEEAAVLKGKEILLPLELLPELPDGDYYLHELVGMEVWTDENKIGNVKGIMNMEAYDLISVDYKGAEVIIPLRDNFLKKVDKHTSRISVELPDGFLDVYR